MLTWHDFYPLWQPHEFRCQHCGVEKMDLVFVADLFELRKQYGKRLTASSGYRCPIHNVAVSTTGPAGPHTTGRSADFLIGWDEAMRLFDIAYKMGRFTGFGFKQHGSTRFLHFDNLPSAPGQPRPRIWSYP